MNKKYGFTFAEVMITLVIVGVVSMLVVPNLLDSSNQKVNAAAAKKAKYEIAQAALAVQSASMNGVNCIRWRCANNNIHTLFPNYLRNTNEIKYMIQNQTNNATQLHVLADVDNDGTTDIDYIVNNEGQITANSDNNKEDCSAENYAEDVANRACTAWPNNGYTPGRD